MATEHAELYLDYLRCVGVRLAPAAEHNVRSIIERTRWEEPESAADLNNVAVLALIEAEFARDRATRAENFELAMQALVESVRLDAAPICVAHLAFTHALVGDYGVAVNDATPRLINILSAASAGVEARRGPADDCLMYWPFDTPRIADRATARTVGRGPELRAALETGDVRVRELMLTGAVVARLNLTVYGDVGLRLQHFAAHCHPDSPCINLRLGIACLMNRQWEGLAYLRRAHQLDPGFPVTLQALYLAFRSLGQEQDAREWLQVARASSRGAADPGQWRWTELEDQPFTCAPFDGGISLRVEASLQSRVTGALLGEGDWFETEMELWRTQLEEGMTVIDVGANVGMYTFSAAQRVGAKGRVYAIEPFSGCVRALEETCRANRLSQVRVRAGAASDANGTARLALHAASEMNSLVPGGAGTGNFEVVRRFTLDSLAEEEGLQRVDWLKIDAEGHEMSVLRGAERLIRTFRPRILYENIDSGERRNTAVAAYLRSMGYRLFRYRGYVCELLPVSSSEEIDDNLNVVALHESRP